MRAPTHRSGNRLAATLSLLILAAFVTLCVMLGGGTRQGLPVESALQLLALILLVVGCRRLDRLPRSGPVEAALLILAGAAGWTALQLLPLPPTLWQMLPGRELLATELSLAGIPEVWRPISLDPQATVRSLFGMLPVAAVLVLASSLDMRSRVFLLKTLLVLAAASCLLGFAQLAGGPDSPLRWHAATSTTQAVGTFANRNHLAAFIVVCLPLAVAGWLRLAARPASDLRTARLLLVTGLFIVLLLGVVITRSRAGLLLGAVAALAVIGMLLKFRSAPLSTSRPAANRRWAVASLAIAAIAVANYGLVGMLERVSSDPMEDRRWTIAATTLDGIRTFGLPGAGAGTFVQAYQSVERPEDRNRYYVNRAHNDWLEWTLEGGLPLLGLLACGVWLLVRATRDALSDPGSLAVWRWAAASGLWLLLLHSVVDYPLRTTALGVVAAVLAACVLPAPPRLDRVRRKHRTHRRSGEESAD